jgi:hypothetical protein
LCLWEKSTFSKPSLAQETSASRFSYRRPDIHCRPSKAGQPLGSDFLQRAEGKRLAG